MKKNFYDIIGVSRNCSQDDIQRAYRKGARRYHPDVNKEADAEERFKELNEAHSVLSDPEKRILYDRWGNDWQQGQQFEAAGGQQRSYDRSAERQGGFSESADSYDGHTFFYSGSGSGPETVYDDIFKEFLGGGFTREGRFEGGFNTGFSSTGKAVYADFNLSLDEIIKGGKKSISFSIDPLSSHAIKEGQTKVIQVKIPPGVTEGSTIRLKGQGMPGHAGGPAGDLLLKIRIIHDDRFVVDGYDLRSEIVVTPWEAALGARVKVETVDGFVWLNIPSGTQSSRQFRLRAKGVPQKEGSGDLLVTVKIAVPESLSAREKELFEELAHKSKFDPRGEREKTEVFEETA